jgi:hypothetical protein
MSWTSRNYFAKAQMYWSNGSSIERDSDQFKLYVSFVCEFVVRGTLCFKHASLNAAPDTESLLFASGVEPRKTESTIVITEGLKRFQRLIPDFTVDAAGKVEALFIARNKELHSDTAEVSQLSIKSIMPSIYQLIVHASDYTGENLETLLGKEDASQARQVVQAASKDRSHRVDSLVKACKDRFFHLPSDEQKKIRQNMQITYESAVLSSGFHVKKEKCPSCSSSGLIIGTPVGRSSPILRENQIVQEVRIVPTKFECKCCGLDIVGLDELMAAGFSHEYCTLDDVDLIEHFRIDPMEHIDVEEVVREYGRDMYEYQDE